MCSSYRDSAISRDDPAEDEEPAFGRTAPCRALVALCLALGALALTAAPAAADVQHVFSRSFTGAGTSCEFTEPGAVALDEKAGYLFVYDRTKNAIDWFGSEHEGKRECILAHKLPHEFEEDYEGLAVDNSSGHSAGDLYAVVNKEHLGELQHEVFKFKPQFNEGKPELHVVQAIKKFRKKEKEAEEIFFEEGIHGVAVDGSGGLWVYANERNILGFSEAEGGEEKVEATTAVEAGGTCSGRRGFAVSANAEFFYVAKERENRNEECEEATALMRVTSEGEPAAEPAYNAQFDTENVTDVAVDQASGDVFADNGTSVSAFSPEGVFIQRFGNESGGGRLIEGLGIAVDAATNEVHVGDLTSINIYAPGEPKSAPAAPPPPPPLPDGRKWEMVSPANKFGASIYGISFTGGTEQAAEDGSAIVYTSSAPIVQTPSTNRSPEPATSLSRRGSQSWGTESISTPHPEVPAGFKSGAGPEYEFFRADLSAGLTNPSEHGLESSTPPPLSPEATEATPYWRDLGVPSSACEPTPSSCYQALVSPLNDTTGEAFGGKVTFTSASPDGTYAVLKSLVRLTPQAPEGPGLYEWERGGALHLVSILPEGETGTISEPKLGGPGEQNGGVMRNAISSDGSRVIWSDEENHTTGEAPLFLRDTKKNETIRLDVRHGLPKPEEEEEAGAIYQTASTDGSKIFFTDTRRLLPESTLAESEEEQEGHGDLYVCEVIEEGGKDACRLKDLTAQVRRNAETGEPIEDAAVQGVIGASEDGSYVYFVADGVLAAGAERGHCVPRNNTEIREEAEGKLSVLGCSLYVEHFNGSTWEAPRLVAPLSTEDQHDWITQPTGRGALAATTSRVSPNGQYLAFMSNASLTGYDNVDAHEEAHGARDEEVFLYNVASALLQCASCHASNAARPSGVLDQENAGEGHGLAIDRPKNWEGRWLAANIPGWTPRSFETALSESRYLSNSGRLFFNSADALVPADNNEKADVYQFEPKGEGSCTSETGCVSLISSGTSKQESSFVEASASGGDVFFLTSEKLVPQDVDTGFDIYDAHACTASSPCLSPPTPTPARCEAEPNEATCRPAQTSVAAPPPVPASTLAGPGNKGAVIVLGTGTSHPKPKPELTNRQKLLKALKACKRFKKKKKRVACERQARRKYGPRKKTQKSAKSRKASARGRR